MEADITRGEREGETLANDRRRLVGFFPGDVAHESRNIDPGGAGIPARYEDTFALLADPADFVQKRPCRADLHTGAAESAMTLAARRSDRCADHRTTVFHDERNRPDVPHVTTGAHAAQAADAQLGIPVEQWFVGELGQALVTVLRQVGWYTDELRQPLQFA